MDALKTIRADVAFTSPDRLDMEGPVFNTFADAAVARAMANRAARFVVLADSSKLTTGGSAVLTPWERVDDLVTDAVPAELREHLEKCGVRVITAPPHPS